MHPLTIGFLLSLLLAAAWHDIRTRRIPNALVFSGAVLGLLLNTALPPEIGGLGLPGSLAGLGVGFILLLPLYLLRAMGAGDVKLMAMTGAFLGVHDVIAAFLCILLAGGVLALGMAWRQHKLSWAVHRLKMMLIIGARKEAVEIPPMTVHLPRNGKAAGLPYGVAIASGTAVYLAVVAFDHWA